MSHKAALAAALLAVASTPAMAQQFTGGELGIEYNTAVDDSIDFDGTSYYGGFEFAIGRPYAVSVNFRNIDVDGGDGAAVATVHGTYHLNNTTSVGAYFSKSLDSDVDAQHIGIEGGTALWGGDINGYVGQIQTDAGDTIAFGLGSETPISQSFSVYTDFDLVADEDIAATTQELGVKYHMASGPQFFVQVGEGTVITGAGSASETYIGIGAEITFGARRGTTFEAR